jgi:hypothetical protein
VSQRQCQSGDTSISDRCSAEVKARQCAVVLQRRRQVCNARVADGKVDDKVLQRSGVLHGGAQHIRATAGKAVAAKVELLKVRKGDEAVAQLLAPCTRSSARQRAAGSQLCSLMDAASGKQTRSMRSTRQHSATHCKGWCSRPRMLLHRGVRLTRRWTVALRVAGVAGTESCGGRNCAPRLTASSWQLLAHQ